MDTIYFDFNKIASNRDFYAQMTENLKLPEYFGNNLDALYDVLTGYVKLPLMFYFNNLSEEKQSDLKDLFATLDDAENETKGQFSYDYSTETENLTE